MDELDKNKRKELQDQYKQIKTYMGVIQIKNKRSGKRFIGVYPNLKNKWVTVQAQLQIGRFANLELQRDWNELGPEAFDYEVLEQKDTGGITDVKWEMKIMEKLWLEELQPYGEQGYNRPLTR